MDKRGSVTLADLCVDLGIEPPKQRQLILVNEVTAADIVKVGSTTGSRNTDTMKVLGRAKATGLEGEDLLIFARSYNSSKNKPPLPDSEIESLVHSADKYKTGHREQDIVIPSELPPIDRSIDLAASPPPLSPVLIDGILRQTHKMSLSGPSKSGKSFALISLALCLAHGKPWLGYACKKCRVLYLNFEIDKASFWSRVMKVADHLGVEAGCENIDVWTLRGYSCDIEVLVPIITERIAGSNYGVIIVDPTYKMFRSKVVPNFEENGANAWAYLFGEFDRLIRLSGVSVIFASHFAKGSAGSKNVIDRTSGSGVQARDPDALLSLTELDTADAYRIEFVLRDFASPSPLSVRWQWPVHVLDSSLDGVALKGGKNSRVDTSGDVDLVLATLKKNPDGLSQRETIKATSPTLSDHRTRKALKDAEDQGLIKVTHALTGKKGYVYTLYK